jgi:sulfhydrogenase subunit beta (sulfur reductase)
MRILKMQEKYLEVFLESLDKFGTLYGPVERRGVLTYDKVENLSEVELGGKHPMIPLKKLFHPKKFTMLHFNERGFYPDYSMIKRRVVLGVHPCEIHGLAKLDDIFLKEPVDPYYKGLRDSTAIIGFSCLPTENSICNATGTDIVKDGFDLFFVDLDEFYLVWVGSSLGHDMIYEREEFFEEDVTHEDIQKYVQWREKRNKMFKHDFDFRSMPDVMELSHDSEVWDYFAEKCLSCGQCSMVCPTCNCYNVTDVFDVTNESVGIRERVWDSCMFVDYSLVSGDHNFRAKRADRLKLWYTHKLKSFGDEYGQPGCVGCGRCVETCPVDINVLTVAEALTAKEVPKH